MKRIRIKFWLPLIIVVTLVGLAQAQIVTDEAQVLYKQLRGAIYQVRVINLATGKKSSIGSGFQFTTQGHLASNYHVIAEIINKPDRYRAEYIAHDGREGPLSLVNVDVIHDIAILKKEPGGAFLSLGRSQLEKGVQIFSLGNPYDLGQTIIEGIYNGLMEKSMYRKILFSGSLNPGMSGGPAISHDGRVIGVNVSTQGNDISFLVPVEHLSELFSKTRGQKASPESKDWHPLIERQLLENQDQYVNSILKTPWQSLPVGKTEVAGEFSGAFKCWGESYNKRKEWVEKSYIQCSNDDIIYVSPDLHTGRIVYKYLWLTSKSFNPMRFYNHFEEVFSYPHPYSNGGEEEVKNFECSERFVDIGARDFKATFCARNYINYPRLYDLNFSIASVDRGDEGLAVELVMQGLSRENILRFIKTFIQSVRWRE